MAKSPKAPTVAPAQVSPTTGKGVVTKPPPEVAGPALKPAPASKQVKLISTQHQPPKQGPATGRLDVQQQQQMGG